MMVCLLGLVFVEAKSRAPCVHFMPKFSVSSADSDVHDLWSAYNKMSVIGTASRRSHRGINSAAAIAIMDHGSPCHNDVVTGSAVLRDSPAYLSVRCWDCQTDFSSPAVPSGMPSHLSISTATTKFIKSSAEEPVQATSRMFMTDFRSHPRLQPAGNFTVSESSTLPDSPQRDEYGDRPHGRNMKSPITSSDSLAFFGNVGLPRKPKLLWC